MKTITSLLISLMIITTAQCGRREATITEFVNLIDLIVELSVFDAVSIVEDIEALIGELNIDVFDSTTITEFVNLLDIVIELAVEDSISITEFVNLLDLVVEVSATNESGLPVIKGLATIAPPETAYLFTGQGSQVEGMGLDTMESQTPIIPILVKDSQLAIEFSRRLFDEGIFISAIRPPTVPHNSSRLRLTVMATHTREDLDCLLEKIKIVGKELSLI